MDNLVMSGHTNLMLWPTVSPKDLIWKTNQICLLQSPGRDMEGGKGTFARSPETFTGFWEKSCKISKNLQALTKLLIFLAVCPFENRPKRIIVEEVLLRDLKTAPGHLTEVLFSTTRFIFSSKLFIYICLPSEPSKNLPVQTVLD